MSGQDCAERVRSLAQRIDELRGRTSGEAFRFIDFPRQVLALWERWWTRGDSNP
jgi:hypothetical protein